MSQRGPGKRFAVGNPGGPDPLVLFPPGGQESHRRAMERRGTLDGRQARDVFAEAGG